MGTMISEIIKQRQSTTQKLTEMRSTKQILSTLLGLFLVVSLQAQQPGIPKQPNSVNSNSSSPDTGMIDKTLNYVNSLFSLYNEYSSSVSANTSRREITFKDKFSVLTGSAYDVEFRRSGGLMGIYCKDGSTCIRVEDTNTGEREDPKVKYTFGLKENGEAIPELDRVVSKLNEVLQSLQGGSTGSSGLSAIARSNLKIINDAFDQYNSYDTVFSVQGTMLHWDSSVANVKADLNNLTFYIDYTNKWMVMRCTSGDCLIGSSSKDSYSMGLQSNDNIAPNIEKVLQAFNDLRREILTN